MSFEDWKTDTFKKVDVRGVQGNYFLSLFHSPLNR